ncbi:tetraspanin-11 isoform X3 [Lepidochelys kempii]|uniref:tetraspanin-11 isoform X3 n=1 Tax=Lepidochelys kempii TaxID=8472 RepID=UPI003C70170F
MERSELAENVLRAVSEESVSFAVGGAAVMAVGIWTLVEKSDYLNILASSTFAVSACILIFAGGLVMITGFLGFCAIIREQRSCLSAYFSMLLLIFLIELVAGVLAYVYYQRLSQVLKQHLTRTLTENYALPGKTHITHSVDRLQQDFKCCGSNSSDDWQHSIYILSVESSGRVVPDSCCKTVTFKCGKRDHPSNIYKVEGGCITKLEQFLADHLLIMGAVGIGVACLQVAIASPTTKLQIPLGWNSATRSEHSQQNKLSFKVMKDSPSMHLWPKEMISF